MKKIITALLLVASIVTMSFLNLKGTSETVMNLGAQVQTMPVFRQSIMKIVHSPATLYLKEEKEVRSPVKGPIAILVDEGDTVEEGQVVATVDTREADKQLREEENKLSKQQNAVARQQQELDKLRSKGNEGNGYEKELELAALNSNEMVKAFAFTHLPETKAKIKKIDDQVKALQKRGSASEAELKVILEAIEEIDKDFTWNRPDGVSDQIKAGLEAMKAVATQLDGVKEKLVTQSQAEESKRAEIEAAELALEQALADLAFVQENVAALLETMVGGEIKAPMAGTVTKIEAVQGEVGAGAVVLKIADISQLMAKLAVDELDISEIQVGMPVMMTYQAFPDQMFTGTVTRTAVTGGGDNMGGGWGPSQGATFDVLATVDDTFGLLRAGMNVETQITAQERHDVLAVPIDALKREETGDYYVWVVEGGRAFKRPVTPGLRTEEQVEIVEGLDEGLEAIMGPSAVVRRLTEGQEVQTSGGGGFGEFGGGGPMGSGGSVILP